MNNSGRPAQLMLLPKCMFICKLAIVFVAFRFDNSNTERLMECMSEEEREEFGFDVGNIDWKDYISNVHIPGLRRHVMKGRGMCS